MIDECGLIDHLSGDAFKLFVVALRHGSKESGGAYGERVLPYSYIKRRFGWGNTKISTVIKELIENDCLRRVYDEYNRAGGLQNGEHVPSKYTVGSAHPAGNQLPAPHVGSGTAPHVGSGEAPTAPHVGSGDLCAKKRSNLASLAEWKAKRGSDES